MVLCIKQQPFNFISKFDITDNNGNFCYRAEGRFSFLKELHVYDNNSHEVLMIKQKAWCFMPSFEVYFSGKLTTTIVQQFSLAEHKYTVEGLGLEIRGDFLGHKYSLDSGDFQIAYMEKEWFTWGDTYVLYVDDPNNELIALASILTIDCMIEAAVS